MHLHHLRVLVPLLGLVALGSLVRVIARTAHDSHAAASERERRHNAERWEHFLARLRWANQDESSVLFTVKRHKEENYSWAPVFQSDESAYDEHGCLGTLSLAPCFLDCNDDNWRIPDGTMLYERKKLETEELYVAEKRLRRFSRPAEASAAKLRVNARDVVVSRRGEDNVRCYATIQNTHHRREAFGRVGPMHDFFDGIANEADVLIAVSSGGVDGEPLHYDLTDNLFLQVSGVKIVHVFSPRNVWHATLRMNPSWMRDRGGQEQGISSTTRTYMLARNITLTPGDILRVPKYHFHRVSCVSPADGGLCVTLSGRQRNRVNRDNGGKEEGGDCVRQFLMYVVDSFQFRGMDKRCAEMVGVPPHRQRSASTTVLPWSFRQLFSAYEHCHDVGELNVDLCRRDASGLHTFALALVEALMTRFPDIGMLGNEEVEEEGGGEGVVNDALQSNTRARVYVRRVFVSRYGEFGELVGCASDCPYADILYDVTPDSKTTTQSIVRAADDVAMMVLNVAMREYDSVISSDDNVLMMSSVTTAASVAASISFALAEAIERHAMSYARSANDACRILRCISEMDFDASILRTS